MKRILTALLLFYICCLVYGQDSIKQEKSIHRISIKTGLYRFYTKDLVYSPLVYKGLSAPLHFEYFNYKDIRNYNVSLQFSNTKLHSALAKEGVVKEDISNYFDFINFAYYDAG